MRRGPCERTPSGLVANVRAAVRGVVLLELAGVIGVAILRADDDAAFVDAALVVADAILGNPGADERADNPAGGAARARAGQRRRDRTGDHETEARNYHRRSHREDRGQRRADAAANRRALAEAFRGFRTVTELGARRHVAEVSLARVFRHHDVDVVGL